jgi:hypothetical protein
VLEHYLVMRTLIVFTMLAFGALFAGQLHAESAQNAMTKTVTYRGGIVVFSIPNHWLEEYEPAGGATFYEDKPDSGTLRLNVLSFDSKDTPAVQMAIKFFPENSYELLQNGFPIRRYVKDAVEKGEHLRIHRWEIAVPVPPRSVRLLMFAHTVLRSQENDPRIKAELSFIDASVRRAVYAQAAGVVGDYQHK